MLESREIERYALKNLGSGGKMRKLLVLFSILFFAFNLYSIDLTGFGAIRTDDWKKFYGVAFAWDLFPFIQLELEGFRMTSNSRNFVSANPLLSIFPPGITPYITVGYGFSGEKNDISTYKSYRNYGGGIKLFIGIVAIRIDYRVIKNHTGNWKRIYGGLDISI